MTATFAIQSECSSLESRIHELKHEKQVLMQIMDQLNRQMDVLQESDVELQDIQNKYLQNLNNAESEEMAIERQKSQKQTEIDDLKKRSSEHLTLRGQYQAEADAQKERIRTRDLLIGEIARKHNFAGFIFEGPLSDNNVNRFRDKLRDEIRDHSKKIQSIKTQASENETELAVEIQNLSTELSATQQAKRLAKGHNVCTALL